MPPHPPRPPHTTRALVGSLLALLIVVAAVVAGTAGLSSARVEGPPPDTIVEITGAATTGFHVRFADGHSVFPPTDSEARAECAEYDTRVARVRCRTEVVVHYRDLTATQQALQWAGQSAGQSAG